MKKSIFILITFIFNSLVIPQDYIKMEFGNGTSSVSDFSMEVQDGSESFEIKVKRLRSNLRGLDFQFEERMNDYGYYNEYIKMLLNLASASGDGITIKGKEHRSGCNTIVLPLDLQKETREKVTNAIQFARLWDAQIRVFSVLLSNDKFVKDKLTRNLEQVEQFILNKGVSCQAELIHVSDDSLSKAVLNYSEKVNADLVMIMTQQESDFNLYFLGSTARSIINESDIPVMSVRPVKRLDTTSYKLQ